MKKLLLLVALIFLTSCDEGTVDVSSEPAPNVTVYKIKIEEHQYLAIKWTTQTGSGVVHDPNCPKCKEIKKSKAEVE